MSTSVNRSSTSRSSPTRGVDALGKIETRGIDYIPEEERHSSPMNLFWVWIGCQMCFGVIVLGWLPVTFGLGWWDAVAAITVGLAVGSLLYAPFSLLGVRTGTNSAVSSGAHFGLLGRLLGSIQALAIALGFAALTVWTGGQAVVAGAHKLIGTPDGNGALAVVYAVIGVIVILVAIYGHANVVALQKFIIPIVGVLLLLGFFALLPHFRADYHGGNYLLGAFLPTWILAVVVSASLPISYGPFANDYARYVSHGRWSDRAVMLGSGVGMFVGTWIAMVWAAYMTTMFKDVSTAFVPGLVAISPSWYVLPLVIVGFLGSFAQGALCLYGTGLDTSSIIPRLARVPATLALSAVAIALVYLGTFLWNAASAVSAFLLLLIIVTTPWMVICLIGFLYNGGRYWPYDLQLFNVGKRGGAYWYTRGFNIRAIAAFVPAVVIGLLFANTAVYVGPWANALQGIDLSFTSAAVISAVIYTVALLLWPENNHPRAGEEAFQSDVPVTDFLSAAPAAEDRVTAST